MKARLFSLFLVLAGLLAASAATAACTTSWKKATGNWSNSDNWDFGVPGASDDACITLDGATFTVNLDVIATVNSLTLGGTSGTQTLLVGDAGDILTMTSDSQITANGVLHWKGGTLVTGTGAALTNAGTILMTTTTDQFLDSAYIVNIGTTTWDNGGIILQNGSTFENQGLLDNHGDDSIVSSGSGPNTFRNTSTGILLKSVGGNNTTIQPGVTFRNAGTIDAKTGAIVIQCNSTQTNATVTASASAEVVFNQGTHTVVGTLSGNPAGVVRMESDATLQSSRRYAPTLNFGGSGFEWRGGVFSGVKPITNAGLLRLTTADDHELDGVSFVNRGTIEWTHGRFQIENGSTVQNRGLVDVQDNGTLETTDSSSNTFTNEGGGVLRKSVATGVTAVEVDVVNEDGGVISAETGTFIFNGALDHQDGALIQGSAEFEPAGSFTFVGNVGPGLSPGTLTWVGDYTPPASSALLTELAGTTAGTEHDQLAVDGTATLDDGTLALSFPGLYVPAVGDAFTVLTATVVSGTFATIDAPIGFTFTETNTLTDVTVTVATVPDVIVAVKPKALAVVGFRLRYTLELTNTTSNDQTVDLWAEVTLPDNTIVLSSIASATLVPAGAVLTQDLRLTLPSPPQIGTYTMHAFAGTFSMGTVVSEDDFTFKAFISAVGSDRPSGSSATLSR